MKISLTKVPSIIFNRIITKNIMHKLVLPFGRDIKAKKWIFVIGCYNSGTTLLASILREHPLMCGLPNEGVFLTDVLRSPEEYGWPRMWYKCMDNLKMVDGEDEEKIANRIKHQWSVFYPKCCDHFIEKSISNLLRIPFLQRNFQPAYFIYIVRNGYAVANGIQRKANLKRWGNIYKESHYPIDMCAQQWVKCDEIVQNEYSEIKNILTIKYEDLTENTIATLKCITDFLGLPPMHNDAINHKWSIHEYTASIKNMNRYSISQLDNSEIETIYNVAEKVLKKYQYEKPPIQSYKTYE